LTVATRAQDRKIASLVLGALLAAAAAVAQSAAPPLDVTSAQLDAHGIGANWLSYHGDYTGQRYSSLTQITPANVANLRAQWVFHSRNAGVLEMTPVVVNGVMYITASNDAYALDATTGQVLWHHTWPITEGLVDDASRHINRGVALWGHQLYMETDNAHLLCLDARSGHLIWDVAYASWMKNYGATSAPLVVHGKVLVGTSGGDDGVRGFIDAFNAKTGALEWRRWTIPGLGESGSSSWPGETYLHGGGAAWMPGTYDPELNTLYWGTGNPSPVYDGSVRPGDDLYTDSLLALDPDTGRMKWYFQFTPHDVYDFDAEETPVLIDIDYHGKPRKLLIEANRNGFIYVLDRTNGRFLSAKRFVPRVNWATGIDPNGRPISANLHPSASGTLTCPGVLGATNWYSPSWNRSTGFFYFMTLDSCTLNFVKPQEFVPGKPFYATGTRDVPDDANQKVLVAFDPQTNQIVWRYPQAGGSQSWGGVMSTATGLVFFADHAGFFEAADGKSGKSLWHFNTGQQFYASPMSYAVGGKQYVAVASGDDLFSFSLP
jgi:alcohol dehydrogenase (cytochrome c)